MHRHTSGNVFEKNGRARVVRNAHRDCDVPAVREKAHLKENGIRRMLRNATGNRTDSSRWPSRNINKRVASFSTIALEFPV